jgi:hypothetical protein
MTNPNKYRALSQRKPTARSRVSNGKEILAGVDGRTHLARRYADICAAVVADMGGEGRVGEVKLSLIRRFSAQCALAEQLETDLVNGKTIDISHHSLLASTLVRLSQRIGINRVPKNVTPNIADYLEQHAVPAE